MYVVQTAFTFSVYLFVLMQGVRMFVGELTNAFQGISNKLLLVLSQQLTLRRPMVLDHLVQSSLVLQLDLLDS